MELRKASMKEYGIQIGYLKFRPVFWLLMHEITQLDRFRGKNSNETGYQLLV